MRLFTARGFLLTASVLGCTTAAVWEVLCAGARARGPAQHSGPPPLAAPGDPARLREEIKTLESLLPRLADRGAALYLLAHHYAHLGEYEKAKALLNECGSLDEGFGSAEG